MKTPQTDLTTAPEPTPEEMLEMLRFQAEIGVDECLLDAPNEIERSSLSSDLAKTTVSETLQHGPPADNKSSQSPIGTPSWQDAQTLEDLKAMASSYDGCDLKKTASNLVFADGNSGADIMLIGEAPGADEDRQGKPFVGASGQLLDKMLASIYIDRSLVYISNIIPWRPPGNRTPTAEEVAMFLPMMKRHIELIAPKILITLGGSSTKALLSTTEGILKLRGQWRDHDINGNAVPMMAMLHPAYLLRTPAQKNLAWKDLRQLYRKAESHGLKFLNA